MRFEHPEILWLLPVVVPALVAFFWWALRERQRLVTQFIEARLLPALTVGGVGRAAEAAHGVCDSRRGAGDCRAGAAAVRFSLGGNKNARAGHRRGD